MGIDTSQISHNPSQSQILSQSSSRHRIHFGQHNNPLMANFASNQTFQLNDQTLTILAKQEIVEENFQQEYDPLFTTFRPQNKQIYGRFKILCSKITNQKIHQYRLVFRNQQQLKTYLMSYYWRKSLSNQNDFPLVRTVNFKMSQDSKRSLRGGIGGFLAKNCSSRKEIISRVYVQDIPLRLCHIKDIPFPQNLYVLKQVLRGFHIIHENIGYIKPFEDLICINRKGYVKVWINSDLSKNFPNIEFMQSNFTTTNSQSKLINQIVQLINANTDSQGQPIPLVIYMKQCHVSMQHITFDKIFQMLAKYCMQYEIEMPSIFGSIIQVLNQQQEEYDTYRTQMQLQQQQHMNSSSANNNNSSSRNNTSNSGLFLDVVNNTNNSSRHNISRNINRNANKNSGRHHKHNHYHRNNGKQQQRQQIDGNNNNINNSNLSNNNTNNRNSNNRNNKKSNLHIPNKTQSLKDNNSKNNNSQSLQSSLVQQNNNNNKHNHNKKSNLVLSQSMPICRQLNPQQSSSNYGQYNYQQQGVNVNNQNDDNGSNVVQNNQHYHLHQRNQSKLNLVAHVVEESANNSYSNFDHQQQQQHQYHRRHNPSSNFHFHHAHNPSIASNPYNELQQKHVLSTNQLPNYTTDPQFANQYTRNKKTYSNLWQRRHKNYTKNQQQQNQHQQQQNQHQQQQNQHQQQQLQNQLLLQEQSQVNDINYINTIKATKQQFQQMMRIDRYLQQQVIEQQFEKDKLQSLKSSQYQSQYHQQQQQGHRDNNNKNYYYQVGDKNVNGLRHQQQQQQYAGYNGHENNGNRCRQQDGNNNSSQLQYYYNPTYQVNNINNDYNNNYNHDNINNSQSQQSAGSPIPIPIYIPQPPRLVNQRHKKQSSFSYTGGVSDRVTPSSMINNNNNNNNNINNLPSRHKSSGQQYLQQQQHEYQQQQQQQYSVLPDLKQQSNRFLVQYRQSAGSNSVRGINNNVANINNINNNHYNSQYINQLRQRHQHQLQQQNHFNQPLSTEINGFSKNIKSAPVYYHNFNNINNINNNPSPLNSKVHIHLSNQSLPVNIQSHKFVNYNNINYCINPNTNIINNTNSITSNQLPQKRQQILVSQSVQSQQYQNQQQPQQHYIPSKTSINNNSIVYVQQQPQCVTNIRNNYNRYNHQTHIIANNNNINNIKNPRPLLLSSTNSPIRPKVTFTISSPQVLSTSSNANHTISSQRSFFNPTNNLQYSQKIYYQPSPYHHLQQRIVRLQPHLTVSNAVAGESSSERRRYNQNYNNYNNNNNLNPNNININTNNDNQSNNNGPNFKRLARRANTVKSNYINSQGIQFSSRKYYQLGENQSMQSKPSVVEYSLLKNPQLFNTKNLNNNNVNNNININTNFLNNYNNNQIQQHSDQNSLQRLPGNKNNIIQKEMLTGSLAVSPHINRISLDQQQQQQNIQEQLSLSQVIVPKINNSDRYYCDGVNNSNNRGNKKRWGNDNQQKKQNQYQYDQRQYQYDQRQYQQQQQRVYEHNNNYINLNNNIYRNNINYSNNYNNNINIYQQLPLIQSQFEYYFIKQPQLQMLTIQQQAHNQTVCNSRSIISPTNKNNNNNQYYQNENNVNNVIPNDNNNNNNNNIITNEYCQQSVNLVTYHRHQNSDSMDNINNSNNSNHYIDNSNNNNHYDNNNNNNSNNNRYDNKNNNNNSHINNNRQQMMILQRQQQQYQNKDNNNHNNKNQQQQHSQQHPESRQQSRTLCVFNQSQSQQQQHQQKILQNNNNIVGQLNNMCQQSKQQLQQQQLQSQRQQQQKQQQYQLSNNNNHQHNQNKVKFNLNANSLYLQGDNHYNGYYVDNNFNNNNYTNKQHLLQIDNNSDSERMKIIVRQSFQSIQSQQIPYRQSQQQFHVFNDRDNGNKRYDNHCQLSQSQNNHNQQQLQQPHNQDINNNNQDYNNMNFIKLSPPQSPPQRSHQHYLKLIATKSIQGSHIQLQPGQAHSNYRFVQSIQENRPNSIYQFDVDYQDSNNNNNNTANRLLLNNNKKDFVICSNRQFTTSEEKNFNRFSAIHTPSHQNDIKASSHSPTESQNPSPTHLRKLPTKPRTGRTMFLNNQNQLTSEFVDPESQIQSQVDYTYNSYDKWKDKSKIGPSRFHQLGSNNNINMNRNGQQQDGILQSSQLQQKQKQHIHKRHIPTNHVLPQRHGNHKKLVKSSIQGMNILANHQFYYFNTDKKNQQNKIKDSRDYYFQFGSPIIRNNSLTKFMRLANQYNQDQIDEEILNDLKAF